ncbi:MAG TPA: hypothetical protein ENG82_01630 [Bacteroidetes bacterium]|nr:hypothetical protein [Bacteroidota bacterium]
MLTPEEFGKQLRRARRAKKLRTRDLYKRTKINEDYLKDMEEGKLNFLPEPYIRAFLKTIAAELNLSSERLLEDYDEIRHPPELFEPPEKSRKQTPKPRKRTLKQTPEKPIQIQAKKRPVKKSKPEEQEAPHPQKEETVPEIKKDETRQKIAADNLPPKPKAENAQKSKPKKTHRMETILILAVGLILIAVGFVYWKYGRQYFVTAQQPVKEITVFEARNEILKKEQEKQKQALALRPHKKQAPVVQSPIKYVTLRIKTLDTTWVRVIRDKADTSEFIFRPGNIRDFKADSLLQLRMGRGDGLLLWVNGDSIGKLSRTAAVVKKLVINKTGIIEKKLRPVQR